MAKLFDKVKIGNLEFRNHVGMAPMGFGHTNCDGAYSDRQIDYYEAKAKGGFGIIYPTATKVTNKFEPEVMPNVLQNSHQAYRLSILTHKVHNYQAKVVLQLSLGLGRICNLDIKSGKPVRSASAVPMFFYPDFTCVPYTVEEIHELVEQFGVSAAMAKSAGADAIEIHAYGGYLIDQFLTPLWNHRTDEYGGSLENRLRIIYELRDAVWATCGKDYPIFIKLTPDHCIEGGRTLEEGIEMLKMLDDAGFAAFHLDKGCYECWYNAVTTIYEDDGNQLYIAKAAKEAGIKTPLVVQGKLYDPEMANKVIEEGIADIVLLGHGSLAEPDWVKKAKNGNIEDIRPCIGCNECLRALLTANHTTCAVNPIIGMENDFALTPATEKLDILVIGGGPAGEVAAITAARRGFNVELWEKSSHLGGALTAAGAPDFKSGVRKYAKYLETQICKLNVPVKFNKEATTEDIIKRNPDIVIMAGGAKPIIPNIPGLENINHVEAITMMSQGKCKGNKVVVLGGGLVGCEAALQLEAEGKEVTVVEMLDNVLMTVEHCLNNDLSLRNMLANSNINIMTKTKLVEAKDGAVVVENSEGTMEIPCDALVLAVGYKADKSLAEALEGKIERVYTIGDNVKSRKVIDAVHEAYHTIRVLEDLI